MRKLLLLVCFWATTVAGRGEVPSWDALQAAVQARDLEKVKGWVSQNGVGSATAANALIAAAMDGDRSMLDQLLALGIPVNATNQFGTSSLLKAADEGITEMVRHLLQRGAKANVVGRCGDANCKGHTALMGAVCKQDLEMAKMLLEAGADPHVAEEAAINTANQNGDVPLFLMLQQFGAREKAAETADDSKSVIPLAALGLSELLPGKVTVEDPPALGTKLRLSVIADDNNLILGDLLSARLSSEASIELIERQELDRVLAEQKLTRQFAADAANYSRVASLLYANALLLIQTRQVANTKVVESRLIRVNPGLALDAVYSSVPVESPPKWAERMGARTVGLVAKVTRTNATALSLLNIRAAVTSSRDRGLEHTIAVMLSDRLAHESHLILLERAAMQRMTFESTDPFWTGSYLVDGTIEPALDKSGRFTISVRFQPTGRAEALLFTATGQQANPAKAIDDLLLKINARLAQASPPQRRDLADEAERYLEEARWALAANRFAAAQATAEAAWALGLHSLEVARLRVLTARLMVRELCYPAASKPESPEVAGWLEYGIHAVTVWRDTLQSELIQGRPEELRKWLAFGLETTDAVALALIRIPTAAERVRQARRIEVLQQLMWESLQEIWTQSAQFPDTTIGNAVSEKQAAIARLLVPRTAELLPAVHGILARKFAKDDAVTRARIRSNLVLYWSLARVMVQTSRTSGQSASWSLPRADDASRQLASELRNSTAPEDRYVSALLSISTASRRSEATPQDVDRLKSSLLDLDKIVAEGGDIFGSYWECFAVLDKLNGVPFFAINRTFNADQSRMWERNTAEHTEFRRQLFLRISATAKVPASHFQKLVSLDQYTPEQAAEVSAAQARLGAPAPARAPIIRGGVAARSEPRTIPEPAPVQSTSGNAAALRVSRLWTPFNLGLKIPPEFRADLGMMTWAEGRLWLHGSTLNEGGQPDQHFIFAIEPDSLRTETMALPERSADLNARIAVTPTHLLFVQRNSLAVRDRSTGRWDRYNEINAANYDPLLIAGDSLYLIVAEPPGNALVSFDFKQRTTEILASTRRRPAASPFDDPGIELKSIATNPAGEIVVVADTFAPNVPSVERVSHAWSPVQKSWREVHPRKLKSALPRLAPPERPAYGRVGTIGKVAGNVVLRFNRNNSQADIPLAFVQQVGAYLPESRYGPQNIRPEYANSFQGGIILQPSFGSGFWVVLQPEIDSFRQTLTASAMSAPQ